MNIHSQSDTHMLAYATRKYFSALGVKARAGPFYGPVTGGNPTGEPEVVISHMLWTRSFKGARRSGRTIYLNGQAFGVMGMAHLVSAD